MSAAGVGLVNSLAAISRLIPSFRDASAFQKNYAYVRHSCNGYRERARDIPVYLRRDLTRIPHVKLLHFLKCIKFIFFYLREEKGLVYFRLITKHASFSRSLKLKAKKSYIFLTDKCDELYIYKCAYINIFLLRVTLHMLIAIWESCYLYANVIFCILYRWYICAYYLYIFFIIYCINAYTYNRYWNRLLLCAWSYTYKYPVILVESSHVNRLEIEFCDAKAFQRKN